MTSVPAKLIATAALAGALVLGGASGALAQNGSGNGSGNGGNGSGNGSGTEDTTTTTAFSGGGDTGGSTALPVTGTEAALTLGGAGALAGLAYAARRAAQARA